MLDSDLIPQNPLIPKPLVCAVSYLNTVPLVWGLEHGPQRGRARLEYALPSACADRVRAGSADIGILPVIEIERQRLEWLPGTGIACRGPVRSILLLSKVPLARVRTLAADIGSRTSVMLARILLAERHGAVPSILPAPAGLEMLEYADAALIIGDPALLLDPAVLGLQYEVLDLGEEWMRHTGLPMVFALWAGRPENLTPGLAAMFVESCRYGLGRIGDIVQAACPPRGIPQDLGRRYLTHHIAFELTERDYAGMRAYLKCAREFDTLRMSTSTGNVSV
ncbi:MAG: Chorismate dehydratase [Bryobacteraceae bacterium]|nr:Chorismate dehydratase [Bryobacteraceae bacterium]